MPRLLHIPRRLVVRKRNSRLRRPRFLEVRVRWQRATLLLLIVPLILLLLFYVSLVKVPHVEDTLHIARPHCEEADSQRLVRG